MRHLAHVFDDTPFSVFGCLPLMEPWITAVVERIERKSFAKVPSTVERSALNVPVPSSNTPLSNTVSWHELNDWQRDNEYILTGYRRYIVLP
jgi:hypothetical protein